MIKRGWRPIGVLLAGLAFAVGPAQAEPNLVNNGGFESGDFAGWDEFGDTSFNGVFCPGPGDGVFEGDCSAFFGPVGVTGGISQDINVAAGLRYHLYFWLYNPGDPSDPDNPDGLPNFFSVSFGGNTLLALVDMPKQSTLYHFGGIASGASETLAFTFQDDPSFLFLDGVQLVIPEPATMALLGAGLAGLGFSRRRRRA